MKKNLTTIVIIFITLIACNTSNKIDTDEAATLIADYLEENPLFEIGKFDTYKQKLSTNKDRDLIASIQQLSEDGLIVVVIPLKESDKIADKIEIISRGFIYVKESEELIDDIKAVVVESIEGFERRDMSQFNYIKNVIFYFFRLFFRTPDCKN